MRETYTIAQIARLAKLKPSTVTVYAWQHGLGKKNGRKKTFTKKEVQMILNRAPKGRGRKKNGGKVAARKLPRKKTSRK